MKKIIVLLVTAFCSLSAFAQQRVDGKVIDQQGDPVAGATIIQKGTFNSTAANGEGEFSLTLHDDEQKVLQVSMIGFKMSETNVQNRITNIRIVLEEDILEVEEVIVVGFGTQKKASATGAISSVRGDELLGTPTSSVTNALTGRIPGLVTRQESGRPGGDDAKLFIRGRATFNDTSPLVMVDGIERSMTQVDQEDIASISVLKDASATAVYGVRGANGVILITTKRGQEGGSKISFSAQTGITSYIRIPETLNAEGVARFTREGLINVGLDPSEITNTTTQNMGLTEYDMYLYRTQESPFTHPDNNFADIFTKPGIQQKYNLNVAGGTKKVKYFVSASYYNEDGMFETDVDKLREHPTLKRLIELSPAVDNALKKPIYDPAYKFNRMSARSNLDINLTDDFSMTIDLTYRFSTQNRPAGYDNLTGDSENMRLFGMFYRNSPQAFPLMNENGSMGGAFGVWRQNPLVTLCYTGFKTDHSNKMETNWSFKYNLRKLLQGLTVDGRVSYDIDWSSYWGVIQRPYIYSYNAAMDTYTQGLANSLPSKGSGRTAATYRKYGEAALRYVNTFNKKHNVSALGLVSYTYASVPNSGNRYSYVPHVYQAIIGRVNYDYANRYLFEANAGYNGSNRFPKEHRYQLFPAASVGWILTNEPFFKENKYLTFLKLRASIGQVGNDKLGSTFSYYYLSTYKDGQSYGLGETYAALPGGNPGLREGTIGNDFIKWEVATKYNLGLETRWFDDNLKVSVDIFTEKRKEILATPGRFTIASGVESLPPMNAGSIENRGYEFEVGYSNRIGTVKYYVTGIYSFARNKVLERNESSKPYSYMYQTNNPIGQYIGYRFDGFFESYEDIASSPQQFGLTNLVPGDAKYKDINGDGIVDETDVSPIEFNPVPEITYSLDFGISWKGLDASVLFQGAARSSVLLVEDIGWDNNWGNYFDNNVGRWTPETAATATYPRFRKSADANHQNYYLSDYWLYDGSYLRLKNVQIGYSVPKKWLKSTPIGKIRVYANAYNLATWDKVKKIDPESPAGTNGYFYPQKKIVNFGINVTF